MEVIMKYYNSEGYADPTAYEALNRIQREERREKHQRKYRPMVYICSPFSHGDKRQNIFNARRFCRMAVKRHCIPIAPHLFFPQFMNDENLEECNLAMLMNKILLGKCDEIWIFGKTYSDGMKREMKWAERKRLRIRFIPEV
jgi:hypothetical protein